MTGQDAYRGAIPGGWHLPIGTPSGNIITTPEVFGFVEGRGTALDVGVEDILFVGAPNSDNSQWWQMILALSAEIWQNSVAGFMNVNLSSPVPVFGNFSHASPGQLLTKVELDLVTAGQWRRQTNGDPRFSEWGHLAFTYEGSTGKLQPICFDNAIFFPEQPGADGFKCWIQPSTTFDGTYGYKDWGSVKVVTPNALPLAFGGADLSGWFEQTFPAALYTDKQVHSVTVPETDASFLLRQTPPHNFYTDTATLGTLDQMYLKQFLIGYLSETWEHLVARNSNVLYEVVLLDDGITKVDDLGGFIRWAVVTVDTPANPKMFEWLHSGIPNYGWVSFRHTGRWTPPLPINDVVVQHTAQFMNADAVAVYLRGGLSGNVQVGGQPMVVTGATIDGVALNLVHGDLALT